MNPITNIKDALELANERRQSDNLQCALRAVQATVVELSMERDRWQQRYTDAVKRGNKLLRELRAVQDTLDEMRSIALLQEQSE